MPAHVVNIGPPAHEDERQALSFLAEGLPNDATVFTNPWLMEPSGAVYELDAVVVMPHAIFVVEIKGWRGHIQGDPDDWYLPETRRSPLLLARKTAQSLHSLLARRSYTAGRVWTQEVIFLPNAASFRTSADAIRRRVALRDGIHTLLTDPAQLDGMSSRRLRPISPADRDEVESAVMVLLQGTPKQRPLRAVAGFEVIDQFDTNERYREVLGQDTTGTRRVLRIYRLPWNASDDELDRVRKRATWEASVLRSFRRAPQDVCLPHVDVPIETDDGLVVPIEHFEGKTLPAWLGTEGLGLDLAARVHLWLRIARALAWTHQSGVIHRQLRPESVLVEGEADPRKPDTPAYRLTGFELAKRQGSGTTVAWSSTRADTLEGAAPEVVQSLTAATPASDQFSLGLLLAFVILRKPLVESTVALIERRHRIPHLRDLDPDVPQRLDDAVARMLRLKPAERFPSVDDAIAHVEAALAPAPTSVPQGLSKGSLLGADFLVEGKLGEGGLSEVYRVKHQLLGERYALKVARPTPVAEAAVQCEYWALRSVAHPTIVKAHTLSRMVEDRVTLQLDLVQGRTLSDAVRDGHLPDGDVLARRRLGEDLLAALDELERIGLSHNDLKPDNLMVTPEGRLVLIDFSLARGPEVDKHMGDERPRGGTFEWRDPAVGPAGHGSDRYAAAMCLFWLHAGRHPFDGEAPQPDEAPDFDAVELEPHTLGDFFCAALDPDPTGRPRTAQALRDAYLKALGAPVSAETPEAQTLAADTRLSTTHLHARAVRTLAAARVETVGELLALGEDALSRVPGLGPRLQARVARLIADAVAQGVRPTEAPTHAAPPFFKPLAHVPARLAELPAEARVLDALRAHGLETIGQVATLPRAELRAIPGIGAGALTVLAESLVRWQEAHDGAAPVRTLDGLWAQATAPLDARQRRVLDAVFGLTGAPQTQTDAAEALGLDQPSVSATKLAALDALDALPLREISGALDGYLGVESGVLPLELARERLARDFPTAEIDPAGVVRALAELDTGAFRLHHSVGEDSVTVVTRSWVTRDLLSRFVQTAADLVRAWPPEPAQAARRTLRLVMPEYDGDPVVLLQRLLPSVCTTAGGALFQPPVSAQQAVQYVLTDARAPLSRADLLDRVAHVFGDKANPVPKLHSLPPLLDGTGWRVDGNSLVRAETAAPRPTALQGDDIRELLALDTAVEPRDRVRDVLRQAAAQGSSFRLVVVPPARHKEIGESLVTQLGATGIDLADAWFQQHADTLHTDARAARFAALKVATGKRMDALLTDLVAQHGAPGRIVVVHNTGLLDALGGLEQVRLLYDRVQGQAAGFWVLVVPGLILDRQPRFNNRTPIWHAPGFVLPLDEPLRG